MFIHEIQEEEIVFVTIFLHSFKGFLLDRYFCSMKPGSAVGLEVTSGNGKASLSTGKSRLTA